MSGVAQENPASEDDLEAGPFQRQPRVQRTAGWERAMHLDHECPGRPPDAEPGRPARAHRVEDDGQPENGGEGEERGPVLWSEAGNSSVTEPRKPARVAADEKRDDLNLGPGPGDEMRKAVADHPRRPLPGAAPPRTARSPA